MSDLLRKYGVPADEESSAPTSILEKYGVTPEPEEDPEVAQAAQAAEDVRFAVDHPLITSFGGKKAIDLAEKTGKAYDVYSGSQALRKGVGDAIDQSDSAEGFGPAGFLRTVGKGLAQNYGREVEAPTGKEILRKTDVGKSLPEWAQSVGGGVTEMVLDPTLALPAGAFSRAAKTGIEATEIGARAVGKGVRGAGRVAAEAADVLIPGVKGMVKVPAQKAGNVVESLIRYVRPEVRPEFVESVGVAVKNGIDPKLLPAAVKYRGGTQSTISKMERVRAQGITGEPYVLQHQQGLNQVRQALDKKIAGHSGGVIASPTEAGEALRNEYHGVVDQFFRDNDMSYDTAWKQVPGLTFSPEAKATVGSAIEGARREAVRMVKRGATPEIQGQGRQLLKIIANAENVVAKGNYKQGTELMRELGNVGFKRIQGVLPENAAIHRDLYGALSEAAIETGRKHLGDDFAEELLKRNEGFTKFFDTQKKMGLNFNDATIPGENIFRAAVESGNSQTIRAMKDILKNRPEALGQLKAAYLENLKTVFKDEGGYSLSAMKRAMDNNPAVSRVMQELFTPEEFKDIYELAKLGDDFGPAILNTSGTDVSRGIRDMFRSVPEALSQDWVIELMKNKAKVPPGARGAVPAELLPTPRAKPGASTQKFVGDILASPKDALQDYFTRLKPTRRQVIGKTTQEYALSKEDQDTTSEQATLQKVQGTPYYDALAQAASRGSNGFASTYYILQQTDPEFRKLVSGEKNQ
jgi:hypothetical protein